MDIRDLQHDVAAMSDGRWFDYPHGSSVRFLVASIYGEKFATAVRERLGDRAEDLRQADGESNDDYAARAAEVRDEAWAKAAEESLLLGWSGLTEDGVSWDFTTERARLILTEPRWQQVGEWIIGKARQRFGLTEDDLGNSPSGSSSRSSRALQADTQLAASNA